MKPTLLPLGATSAGLSRYRLHLLPPPVRVADVISNQRHGAVAEIALPSTQFYLAFEYRGASFGMRPEDLVYAYRLAGRDREWRWTKAARVEYLDLERGDYTFEVRAVDRDLNYSQEPARVRVRVRWPYERMAWIGVAAVGVLLFLWQTARIVRRDRKLVQVNHYLQQRTAELEVANQNLQNAQAQLMQAEKMATLGLLAGGVAHELNNPLQAILGGARRILRYPGDQERHRESASLVEQAAQRCHTIIQNLLSYTRRARSDWEPVDLNQVVESTLSLLHHHLEEEGVQVRFARSELSSIEGNFNELCTVVTNLVVNARDAALQGSGAPAIEIATAPADEGVVLQVSDNGPGIPPVRRERIFDPFYTTKDIGQGTGLGLSIVQGIVKRHNGRIEVVSEEGEGALFAVYLPAHPS